MMRTKFSVLELEMSEEASKVSSVLNLKEEVRDIKATAVSKDEMATLENSIPAHYATV